MNEPREQNLAAQLNLIKFPANTTLKYELDQGTEWVKNLLLEMNETATDKTPDEWLKETFLNIDLSITKKFKNEYGEYLLVQGAFAVKFVTESVRTLKTVEEEHDVEFKAVLFEEQILKGEEFAELDEMWLDGETYTIYSFEKTTANIAEMLHEQLFLCRDLYPLAPGEEDMDASVDSDKPRQ